MNKKIYTAVFIVAVLLLGLIAAVFLVRQRQEIRRRAQVPTDVSVSLSPPSQTIPKGGKATVNILLANTSAPARSINLYSAEVELAFDPSYFSVSNLACDGGFLSSPAVNNVSANKISLACFAPGGSGTRTIASGGQATLGSFDITAQDKEGASPITFSRVNVPDATTFTDLSGGTGTGGTYTIAAVGGPPEGTATPTPTGQPNSCGGTCGSEANCQSGLFCTSFGLCRNPSCPSSINCSCATATPTAKPKPKGSATATPTSTPTSTPLATTLIETPTPTEVPTPTSQPQPAKGPNPIFLAGIGAGILFLLIALLAVFRGGGKGGNPPKITPPTPTATPPSSFPTQPPAAPPLPPSPPPV